MAVTFSDVKQILDEAIAGWKARNGRDPNLAVHGPTFGWDTRDELLRAEGFGFRLIDPSMIGNNMGHQTNLVISLRDPNGVAFLGQMPRGGPYLSAEKIDAIVEWINDGALADAECESRQTEHDVSETVTMEMRDPDVQRQSDLDPYPDGPGKLLYKWDVSIGFNKHVPSPVQIRVTGVDSGTPGTQPGNVFDGIQANDVFQDTGRVYDGTESSGCMVLQNAAIPPTQTPPYDPTANLFPDPNQTYPFHHMPQHGRWFLVQWKITVDGTEPSLQLTAAQQPRVNSVAERRCP